MPTGERGGYYGSSATFWDDLRGIDDGKLDHTADDYGLQCGKRRLYSLYAAQRSNPLDAGRAKESIGL